MIAPDAGKDTPTATNPAIKDLRSAVGEESGDTGFVVHALAEDATKERTKSENSILPLGQLKNKNRLIFRVRGENGQRFGLKTMSDGFCFACVPSADVCRPLKKMEVLVKS